MRKAIIYGGPISFGGPATEPERLVPMKFFAPSRIPLSGAIYGASSLVSDYEADIRQKSMHESLQRIEKRLDRIEALSEDAGPAALEYTSEELVLIRRFFEDATGADTKYAYENGHLRLSDVMEMALESLENASATAAQTVSESVSMRRVIDRNSRLIDSQQVALTSAIKKLSILEDV